MNMPGRMLGLVLVVGTAVGGCASADSRASDQARAPHAAVHAEPVVATPASTVSGSCAGSVPLPTWTPSIVVGSTVECPDAAAVPQQAGAVGAVTGPANHVGTFVTYTLAGAANQDASTPPAQMTAAGIAAGSYHPATAITLVVYPDPNAIDTGVNGAGIEVSHVTLASGPVALVTQGSNGYGAIRVAWTDGHRSFLLITIAMKTDAGTSGVGLDDLLTMAASIPPPS